MSVDRVIGEPMEALRRFSITLLILIAILAVGASSQQPQKMNISENDAKILVLAALPSKNRHLPKLALDVAVDNRFPGYSRFYVVEVTWQGPPNGSSGQRVLC